MNHVEISKAKMPALVAFYNERSGKAKPITKFADIATARKRCIALLPKEDQPSKPVAKKAKLDKVPGDRSAKISASWGDNFVRAARLERTSVRVSGTDYKSVREAFVALGLPLSRHIRLRMNLKAAADGKATFEHEDKKYNFISSTRSTVV